MLECGAAEEFCNGFVKKSQLREQYLLEDKSSKVSARGVYSE